MKKTVGTNGYNKSNEERSSDHSGNKVSFMQDTYYVSKDLDMFHSPDAYCWHDNRNIKGFKLNIDTRRYFVSSHGYFLDRRSYLTGRSDV